MTTHADLAPIRRALASPRDVAARLGWRGVPQAGGGVSVLCPAHGDKGTPSLSMTLDRAGFLRVHCFGCAFNGDVFHLLGKVHALNTRNGGDFARIIEHAATLADMAAPASAATWEAPPTIADPTFRAIVTELLRRCPMRGDVARYMWRRGVEDDARRDGWGALPPWHEQGKLIDRLLATFDAVQLVGSGLCYQREDGGAFFVHSGARVLIPWRDASGEVATLQRRRLDAHPIKPRYVFPAGRPPSRPYGVERLERLPAAPIAYVEGAVDALACRVLARIKRRDVVPLALPGVEAWRTSWAAHASGRVVWVALDDEPDVSAEERVRLAGMGKRCTRDVVEAKCDVIARECAEAGAAMVRRVRPVGAKDWAAMLEKRRGG